MNEPLWAIVPAAGQGVRAGLQVPKQFARIGDKTVLEWTVSRLLALPDVSGVVVAVPPAMPQGPSAVSGFALPGTGLPGMSTPDKPVLFVPGGNSRQESVYLALSAVPMDVRWIAVHDAARPCFTPDLFRRVFLAAKLSLAAICGLRPTDTIKVVRQGSTPVTSLVASTPDRDSLLAVQTPQVFEAGLLRRAHREARDRGFVGTDDSQLVEALGHPVAVVQGERQNIKITYPEDLETAMKRLIEDSPPRRTVRGRSFRYRRVGRVRERCGGGGVTVTGFGFDIHPLTAGRKCVLGGVLIPSDKGPLGHSDGDVLCHAVMDAILGGLGRGDIGQWFPPGDPRYAGACSVGLLRDMWKRLMDEAEVLHVDATVVAETPKISPFYGAMRDAIGQALEISPSRVSVKATTAEKLGSIGRGEGIAAFAVVTLRKRPEGLL